MPHPIIAGIDGSAGSLHAAGVASRIAQAARVRLILVFAVPTISAPDAMFPEVQSSDLIERLIHEVRQGLSEAGAREGIPGSVIDSLVVRPGRAGAVLNEVALAYHAQLIVVGGRLHGALSRSFGGSTAHHLVRTAESIVLVVDTAVGVPQRLLAAIDLSPAAGPTLAAAARYTNLLGGRLRVVHIVEPMRNSSKAPLPIDMNALAKGRRAEFERMLDAEVPAEDRVVRLGLAEDEIVEEATAWRADLVVLGTHSKQWIDRMLIGSTTERLLNRLPTSLLIVPIKRQQRNARQRASGLRKSAARQRGKRRA